MRWPPPRPGAPLLVFGSRRGHRHRREPAARSDRTGARGAALYDGVAHTPVGRGGRRRGGDARAARALLRPRGVGGGDDARPRWRHRAAAVGDLPGLFAGGGLDVMTTALRRRCLRRHHARACSTLAAARALDAARSARAAAAARCGCTCSTPTPSRCSRRGATSPTPRRTCSPTASRRCRGALLRLDRREPAGPGCRPIRCSASSVAPRAPLPGGELRSGAPSCRWARCSPRNEARGCSHALRRRAVQRVGRAEAAKGGEEGEGEGGGSE